MVGEAMKGNQYPTACVFEQLGYPVNPPMRPLPGCIQRFSSVLLKSWFFCKAIQQHSPIGSLSDISIPLRCQVTRSQFVVIGGTFIDGSTQSFQLMVLREPCRFFLPRRDALTHVAIAEAAIQAVACHRHLGKHQHHHC